MQKMFKYLVVAVAASALAFASPALAGKGGGGGGKGGGGKHHAGGSKGGGGGHHASGGPGTSNGCGSCGGGGQPGHGGHGGHGGGKPGFKFTNNNTNHNTNNNTNNNSNKNYNSSYSNSSAYAKGGSSNVVVNASSKSSFMDLSGPIMMMAVMGMQNRRDERPVVYQQPVPRESRCMDVSVKDMGDGIQRMIPLKPCGNEPVTSKY